MFRAFATLEGTLRLLRPGFDLVGQARAVGSRRIAEALTPDRMRGTLEDELAALLPMLRGLPRRIDRIGDALEHGRLRLNIRLFADDQDRRLVTGLLLQALPTVIGAAAGVMAVILLDTGDGPRRATLSRRSTIFGRLVPSRCHAPVPDPQVWVAAGRFMATVLARRWR